MKAHNHHSMPSYLLKVAGLATLVLSLHSSVSAQPGEDRDTLANKLRDNDEIVIKSKSDKDIKLDVEIKDDKVFINGKPLDEFIDDDVSVHKKKMMVMDGRTFNLAGTGGLQNFEFRGGTFLGVNSRRSEDDAEGAKVVDVTKGSAADTAGLKAGDLITRVDETPISGPQDLSSTIHKYKPTDKITLTYKRNGKEQKTTAVLGKFNGPDLAFNFNRSGPNMKDFNFTMPPMPNVDEFRGFAWNDGRPKIGIKAQDREEGKGAKVLDVDDESAAEKAGIREGDIITRFDGKDVDNATMLADLARESKDKASVKIGLIRDGKSLEIEVKVPRKLKTADL